MQITITLTERELAFLENLQQLFDSQKQDKKQYTLEDIMHVLIENAIYLGESMHRGQA